MFEEHYVPTKCRVFCFFFLLSFLFILILFFLQYVDTNDYTFAAYSRWFFASQQMALT